MKCLFLAVALGLSLPAGAAAAEPQEASPSLVTGTTACAGWLASRTRDRSASGEFEAWMTGYVAGYDRWLRIAERPADGAADDALIGWLLDYCRRHPDARVAAAAGALVYERLTRR